METPPNQDAQHHPAPVVPHKIEDVLARYVEIQEREQILKEEKAALQDRIADHMEQSGQHQWFTRLGARELKVRCSTAVVVEYDEAKLQARLGERYAAILAPDPRKIRQHLNELDSTLAPVLSLIGSPVPEKVRAAVAQGLVKTAEFAGAFTKTTRRLVAVSRVKPTGQDAPAGEKPNVEH